MPCFYSPTGNAEIWEECPEGYLTAEEWSAQHPPAEPTDEELFAALRRDRDSLLSPVLKVLDRHRNQADFGLPTTLTTEQATAWAVYAQELRDLPETTTDPANPVWPEAPEEAETDGE